MTWVWVRTQGRRRRATAWATTVLFGLAVGVVLTAVAGGRRTETAYPRMVTATHAADLLLNPDQGARTRLDFDAVEHLPNVRQLGRAAGMLIVPQDEHGQPDFTQSILSVASADGHFGYDIGRLLYVEGGPPDPSRPDEIALDPDLAHHLGVGVGDEATLLVPDVSQGPPTGDQLPPFQAQQFRVTGLGWDTSQVLSDETVSTNMMLLTPAYYRAHTDTIGYWGLFADLDRAAPDDVLRFRREVDRLAGEEDIEYRSQQVDTDAVARAVHPQVVALYAFAALIGLAALVIVGQALARALTLEADEALTLQAIGLRRRSLFAGGLLRAGLLAAAGAAIAVVVAVAASGRFPVGVAHRAEPHPGTAVNAAVLAVGAVLAIAAVLAVVAIPLWRSTGLSRRAERAARPSRGARTLRSWGVGPAVSTGVNFALEPAPGRTTAGLWASMVAGVTVAALLSAVAAFGASLAHLADSPALYGWNWDVRIDSGLTVPALQRFLDHDPRVEASSRSTNNRLELDGVPIPSIGVSPADGAVTPTVVEGTPPRHREDVALGGRTMSRLGVGIGDRVTARAPDGTTERLRVVGRAAFPGLGTYGGSERTELGTGAMTTVATLGRLGPRIRNGQELVRLAPGTDRQAFADDVTNLLLHSTVNGHPITVDQIEISVEPQRPTDIVALDKVRRTPQVLALMVAGLILVQLVIVVFTSSRKRRHDLALLTTVGFLSRQVAATVAWQTLTLVTISLVVGIPLGVAAGRSIWTALADHLGAAAVPVTPLAQLGLLAGATLVLGGALAFAGGALLARTRPATVLRSE